LPAFLRLRRVQPRRRLGGLTARLGAADWPPSRPGLRLASALGAMVLLLTAGVLAVGALDDEDTVPAEASPDRSLVPNTSRSADRPTLSPLPHDADTPDADATSQDRAPRHRSTPDTEASAPETPTQEGPASTEESPPPVRAPAVPPTDETPSLPTSTTPDVTEPARVTADDSGHRHEAPSATPVDRAAPSTVLDSTPEQRDDSTTADFSFHATEAASFTCSLDGGAFRPCGSGVGYAVEPGWHYFAVRATDGAGNVDPSPARWHWHTTARD
jgi:hypothetical protein